MRYIRKGILFLRSPQRGFDNEKEKGLKESFKYVLALAIILAVLGALVSTSMLSFLSSVMSIPLPFDLPVLFLRSLVLNYVMTVAGLIIWSLWLHLWAYVFGARNGLVQTMKSVFYGGTPNYMFGWIPVFSIIAMIWSWFLTGIGLIRLQGINSEKAALAIIIAIAIPLIIAAVYLASMVFALLAFNPMSAPAFPGY